MRMMLKARIPNAEGNAAINNRTMSMVMRETLERIKPEACYFGLEDGMRSIYIFFDMGAASEIVSKLEPLFLNLNCQLEIQPVMVVDDLVAGFNSLL